MNQAVSKTQSGSYLSIPNILLVSSGKGGVGKTWFSISYANALAKKNMKVLLFDGDLGLANVDIQLGLTPKYDLGHYIHDECTLKESITPYKEGGFDIIAGRSGCGSLSTLPLSKIETLLQDLAVLAKEYDTVVLDLGAGLGGIVRQLSKLAGKCIVLSTDEPTSLTDAYAFIKYSRSTIPDLDMYIVINKAPNVKAGQKTFDTIRTVCKNFLNYTPKLAGIIPDDKGIIESIRYQQPLFTRYPHSEAATEVQKITELVNENRTENS